MHWHDEEQISFVLDGEFEFEVAGEKRIAAPGRGGRDPAQRPARRAHARQRPCLEVDVFHPPRQGVLDAMAPRGEPRVELGLAGRRALVTGGSKGLGFAIAQELVREGAHVAICSRSEDEVRGRRRGAGPGGTTVHAQAADVTDPAQVRDFVARSAEALGGVDCLVNNAGRAHPGTFATLDRRGLAGATSTSSCSRSSAAAARCCRTCAPRAAAGSSTSAPSTAAIPIRPSSRTSVNRAAGNSFTKTLALEVAKDGILVNGVNIGFVVTPQWDNIHQRRAPELAREEFFAQPRRRARCRSAASATPDEVSGIVAFLLSERASYITGASIDVAGGMGKYV